MLNQNLIENVPTSSSLYISYAYSLLKSQLWRQTWKHLNIIFCDVFFSFSQPALVRVSLIVILAVWAKMLYERMNVRSQMVHMPFRTSFKSLEFHNLHRLTFFFFILLLLTPDILRRFHVNLCFLYLFLFFMCRSVCEC